jgi:hypothetical protein
VVSASYLRLIGWMNTSIQAGDRVLLGPTQEFNGLLWMVERPVSVVITPAVSSFGEYDRYLRERGVRYVVMSPQSGILGSLKDALGPYVTVSPDSSIVQKQPMPGWRAVYVDPGTPSRFVIYEDAQVRPTRS